MSEEPTAGGIGRRRLLAGTGAALTSGLGGCLGVFESGIDDEVGGEWIRQWNDRYIEAVQAYRDGNVEPTRRAALLNVAIFDAVNAITGVRGAAHYDPYQVTVDDAPRDGSRIAAGAAAAHGVLDQLYPAAEFTDTLEDSLGLAREHDGDVPAGKAWGSDVADAVLASRADDGDYEAEEYVACESSPTAPGCYRRRWNPVYAFARPWTLDRRDQFRPAGPPPLESQAYADAWKETYEYGRHTDDRPEEEVEIAGFWRGAPGSPRPPNMWNVIASRILADEPLPLLDTARLFALLSVALADAGIAGSEGKYHYGFWRPQTAIHAADEDGNTETYADPDWRPLSVGSSPEYPSTLAAYGGAARRILVDVLGDDEYAFSFGEGINTGINGDQRGRSRSFESITDALNESTRSRIYLGNHFEFTLADGEQLGDRVGEWALAEYFKPRN